jgi:hypothetical protein
MPWRPARRGAPPMSGQSSVSGSASPVDARSLSQNRSADDRQRVAAALRGWCRLTATAEWMRTRRPAVAKERLGGCEGNPAASTSGSGRRPYLTLTSPPPSTPGRHGSTARVGRHIALATLRSARAGSPGHGHAVPARSAEVAATRGRKADQQAGTRAGVNAAAGMPAATGAQARDRRRLRISSTRNGRAAIPAASAPWSGHSRRAGQQNRASPEVEDQVGFW